MVKKIVVNKNLATAQTSNNTNMEVCEKNKEVKKWKNGKHRDFLLTTNYELSDDINECKVKLLEKYKLIENYLLSLKYTFLLTSLEKNKKGFYHTHTLIQFNTPHKLSIKKCQGAHIDIIKHSINKVIDYVKKDGCIIAEYGHPKFISGNPSIKDISLSRMSDINENAPAQFYRLYKEIKQDNQPLFNTHKNVYILSLLPSTDKFNQFNFLMFNKTKKIKNFPIHMIIEEHNISEILIKVLLDKYNRPIQFKFFPANVENIIFIFNNLTLKNIKYYNVLKYYEETIKTISIIEDNFNYTNGLIDSDEFTETDDE